MGCLGTIAAPGVVQGIHQNPGIPFRDRTPQFTGINPPKPLHPDSGTTTILLTGIPFRWHAPPHEIAETPCCPIFAFPCFKAVPPRSNRGYASRRPTTNSAWDDLRHLRHSCHLQTRHPQEGTSEAKQCSPQSNFTRLQFVEGGARARQFPEATAQNEIAPGRRETGAKDRQQDPRHCRSPAAHSIAGSVCIGDSRGPESARSDSGPLRFAPFPA